MAEKTVAAPDIQTPNTTESTRHHERYVAPPVDIHETREGLVVLARFEVRCVNLKFTQG